ncbi:MAG TPA: hypothetical protein VG734_01690 [Lacunisphaera sp.]|nr:hypothetical protein [Lacunisphaera sp.]
MLRLFGLNCVVNGNTVAPPAGATWDAHINAGILVVSNGRLNVGVAVLQLALRVPVRQSAGDWFPADGDHDDGNLLVRLFASGQPTPSHPFALRLHGLSLAGPTWPDRPLRVRGGDLTFNFRGRDGDLVLDDTAPIKVKPSEGNLQLDLRARVARLSAGSILATTSHRLAQRNPNDDDGALVPFDFMPKGWASREVSLALDATTTATELTFSEADDKPLALHGHVLGAQIYTSRAAPLIAPVAMREAALQVTLERDGERVELTELRAVPGGSDGVALLSHIYSDARNAAVVWRAEQALALKLRVGVRGRPATLLLAETVDPARIRRDSAAPAKEFHGIVAEVGFSPPDVGHLHCAPGLPFTGTPAASISHRLLTELTVPRLSFQGETRLRHAKAGRAYQKLTAAEAATTELSVLALSGQALDLPLLGDSAFQGSGADAVRNDHYDALNATLRSLSAPQERAVHARLMRERPSTEGATVQLRDAFRALKPASGAHATRATFDAHQIRRDFGLVEIPVAINPNDELGYVILRPSGPPISIDHTIDPATKLRVVGPGHAQAGPCIGVMKLGDAESIAEILAREHLTPRTDEVPPAILHDKSWHGVLLFDRALNSELAGMLHELLPEGLSFSYFAFSPSGDENRHSVSARVRWSNPATELQATTADNEETQFRLKEVDILWQDSQLLHCHVLAELTFQSALGLAHAGELPTLRILGSYDHDTRKIRFVGDLGEQVGILPRDVSFGPFRQLYVRGAEIVFVDGKTIAQLHGQIELQPSLPMLDVGPDAIDFDSLEIQFPGGSGGTGTRRLALSYPNLKFRFDKPPLRFGFMDLKLRGFGVSFNNFLEKWNAAQLVNLSNFSLPALPNGRSRGMLLEFRMELMKMPELSLMSVGRLTIDFFVGLALDEHGRWSRGTMGYGLRGLSLRKLRLDLLRFLVLEVEEASLERVADTNWFNFTGVSLAILNQEIVEDLSVRVFSRRSQTGFLAYLDDEISVGSLNIYWILIGQNLAPDAALARRMMEIEPPSSANGQREVRRAIKEAVRQGTLLPGDREGLSAWVFAAGFNFLGLFEGKFLFQDQRYYGISMVGGVLKEWFGYDVGISVLYIKGNRPDEDSFAVSVRVPAVTLPAFHFMGGVVAIEIVLNGGFTLDVGFPWLPANGPRAWHRAFGAIVGIFQGCAGFYLSKRSFSLVKENAEYRALTLGGGYALQAGLGGAFGAGGSVFRVWASVGLYTIIEGEVWFLKEASASGLGRLAALRFVGAVGILVRGGAELNFWIISVRIEVFISAEARLTVAWGKRELLLASGENAIAPGEDGRVVAQVDFELWVRASARACIGGGWFKICAGIDVSIPMRFNYKLAL